MTTKMSAQKFHKLINLSFEQVLSTIADENKPTLKEIIARPFLKWAGGKRSILQKLIDRMPKEYKGNFIYSSQNNNNKGGKNDHSRKI